ncbi:MAG: hypothetical protein ABIF11_10795 [Nitrospirota bacterium]
MMEIKETSVIFLPEEIIQLIGICEDADKDNALSFLKELRKKVEKVQSGARSSYQRGGHIGPAKY